jgi:hypothetical protein
MNIIFSLISVFKLPGFNQFMSELRESFLFPHLLHGTVKRLPTNMWKNRAKFDIMLQIE